MGARGALGTIGAVVVLVLLGTATPARAAPSGTINGYDSRIQVGVDGTLAVTETLTYDFGTARQHGIFRKIPVRARYDDARDRRYEVDAIAATMDGVAVPESHWTDGAELEIRLGDPAVTVTGRHTYTLRYSVRGALNHFGDHEELYWNVVGPEWSVSIASATATVTGPAPVTRVDCFAGRPGNTDRCAETSVAGATASFSDPGLGNGAGLTVVVAFPPGSVHSGPILVPRRGLGQAFRITPGTVGGALGLGLGLVGGALLLGWRVGRDRRYRGLLPGLVPQPGESAVQVRKPLVGAPPVSVEFTPPGDIRPGQVGTLIDERADVLDVTATIVDLAVRRYLHIRELPGRDWELTRLPPPPGRLAPYERTLVRALFRPGGTVRLSELTGKIGPDVQRVRDQLYRDLVVQGWYRRRPDRVRRRARAWAFLALVVALVGTVGLAANTQLALLGLGPVAGAVTLLVVAGRFPARTGTGSAMLERVKGLRLYIATAEAEQLRFQEREQIFSRYLPYAMVFGLTERWARVFRDIGLDERLYWYDGQFLGYQGFSTAAAASVGAFPASAAAGVATAGSGFSGGLAGGGGGGGGGGTW